MKLKTLIGSLTLASLLVGGPSLAAPPYEPTPPHDSKPAPIPDSDTEMVRVPLSAVLRDAEREDLEKEPEEGFLPDLPILVDGEKYTPAEIQEKDIHLSHYVLDGRSAELGVVQGFRTTEELKKYLTETDQFPSEQPSEKQLACDPYSWFFEHAGYWGNYFTVYPGYGYNYVGNFWNDRISSIWSTQCGRWTLVTEHSNFGGHVLWIGRNLAIYNLSSYGWYTGWWPFRRWHSWNDRISSVAVYW